ncbi:MAG: response regulator [Ignavibacteriaceae bacterium]|nr:response regulator [Ignavibacteriaceae bacterium]
MEKKKNILVIDDEPDAIEFVRAVLSSLGEFNIIEANDGEEGLIKAKKNSPDLVILDIIMPRQSGFDVFYELRKNKHTKNIPIVMLTGVADKAGLKFFKDDMKKYFGSEPIEYLEKPLNPDSLIDTVKKIFNI